MYEDLIVPFIVAPAVIILIYLKHRYSRSGLGAPVEVQSTESATPSAFNKSTTIFYKHHIGAYTETEKELSHLVTILPTGARTVQILYDDENVEQSTRLQSAYGCIFGEDGEDFYTQNFVSQLKRFGYERLVVKPLGSAVWTETPANDSIFSRWNLSSRVRPALRKAVEASGKLAEAAPIIVHVYDSESSTVESFVPLENAEEFIDAEHLSSDELTGKLARKCFDSDAESSESEPDFSGDEAEDENDEPAEE